MAPILLSFIISSALFILLYFAVIKEDISTRGQKDGKYGYLFLLLAALAARLIIAPIIEGYRFDMGCWRSWSSRMAQMGPYGFYDPTGEYFCDYPPGYMYFLWLIGVINRLFSGMSGSVHNTLLKLPAIICDIVIGFLIYRAALRKTGRTATSLTLSAFYLFNPATVLNSAIWGQIDSVLTLFLGLSILFLTEEKYYKSAALYALAVLIKPQALMFAPVFLFALIDKIVSDRDYKKWLITFGKCAGIAFAAFILVALPFALSQKPSWIFELYFNTLSSYPYASINAYNFFALIKANAVSISGKFFIIPYGVLGYGLMIAVIILSGRLFVKGQDKSKFFYISALMMSLFFTFGAKMHERYLFPTILLYTLAYIYRPDGRILLLGGLFSSHHFLNTALVLKDALKSEIYYTPNGDPLMLFLSAAAVLLTVYAVYLGNKLYGAPKADSAVHANNIKGGKGKKYKNKKGATQKSHVLSALSPGGTGKMTWLDWLLLAALTVFYASIALPGLGDMKAPESGVAVMPGKAVTFDFGETKEFTKLLYYKGVEPGEISIHTSFDNENWQNAFSFEVKECYTWYTKRQKLTARYVSLTTSQPILIYEIGFFEEGSDRPTPPVSGGGALFDEQEVVPAHPSYTNGMYFDEIYHARTAKEHLDLVEPYENTHPPLGKLIISIGILLFGMNPFGWRIAGTVVGILMVPAMYLFAKRLFKNTAYAFIAAFMMTFDFMHFSQTRIATIDTFVVFFIILMYYFMYRYYELDLTKTTPNKSLVPLAFSGIFMGLGIASKWTGIYAGFGLAVLFFTALARRQKKTGDTAFTIKTLLWCLVFFVLVPLAIYTASYIPIIKAPGNSLADVWGFQKHMLSYHSGLQATHPYSSNWYEWPIIKRPVWFYAADTADMPEGMVSSIVTMGNPALWWAGAVAIILSFVYASQLKDKRLNFLIVAFLSQYLPWVLVGRIVFIYHFFTSVPFMFLMLAYWLGVYIERAASGGNAALYKKRILTVAGYLTLCAVLFFMFFPVLSGTSVARDYIKEYLKWIPSWVLSN